MNVSKSGQTLFGRYAYPPNELGYCGPTERGGAAGLASHAQEFDGAWPYLTAIADACGAGDALDEEVVNSYWVGGPALYKVDPGQLLGRLRAAFTGQLTGLLDTVPANADVLAHHSFHVFVVYPWIRFVRRDPRTALGVMQDCRIRWGTVDSVSGEHALVSSRPLQLDDGMLVLGPPRSEEVRWRQGDLSLTPAPSPGATVSAHWGWLCATLTETDCEALAAATQTTLDLVNSCLEQGVRS
ncbi:DUF6390 family protein [Mycobacterium sp. IDR2000157661]|uniref:DUF6390 family protein n=1 Tax=Mycobacterium sp. IDR2000157661 TaxID=2867005 RepID=UPI001EECB03F|nr:DUF6390 family protein [Mycobacterium sp. IDR2000157661]ULE32961.1 hypothetical protein K3G64_23335 [Mycobacterium sp. IDR2000157661]